MHTKEMIVAVLCLPLLFCGNAAALAAGRQVVSLDGEWEIASGTREQRPESFTRTAPVPGFVDMAEPAFEHVGENTRILSFGENTLHKHEPIPDPHHEAFWYRKTFTVDGPIPKVAVLKIGKAKYGAHVWLNGRDLGAHWPNFTPGYFDVRDALRGDGAENELLVRLGPSPTYVENHSADGLDYEKQSYLAGIYDSVQLILTGSPCVANVQVVPEIEEETARVVALIRNESDSEQSTSVRFRVTPYESDETVGEAGTDTVVLNAKSARKVEARVPIQNCRLWTPEEPNLYRVHCSTDADEMAARFGMRSFRFDPETKQPLLNGEPYYMRGTNVCFFRFAEDPHRGGKPWDETWVRKLHRRFKSMNRNSCRYCIGFPPEMWYRIADEEGLLIQDEFPIWTLGKGERLRVSAPVLAAEYESWMREHWNYPCVVIWDAQNESHTETTGEAIGRVRGLDLSDRPWENGWAEPEHPLDAREEHHYPYLTPFAYGRGEVGDVLDTAAQYQKAAKPKKQTGNPIIVNEYGWLWLKRDGEPTYLTETGYEKYLPEADVTERREFYARNLAALTETMRATRQYAGILHFCGLTHSVPDCYTSDHLLDLAALEFEPHFEERVRDAFAPLGLCLDLKTSKFAPEAKVKIPVVVINDWNEPRDGKVRLRLRTDHEVLIDTWRLTEVPAYGRAVVHQEIVMPEPEIAYWLEAEIDGPEGEPVMSRRLIHVGE